MHRRRATWPLISTIGGFPGEKKRSLICGALLSIAANSAAVEIGATAAARGGSGAAPAAETDWAYSCAFIAVDLFCHSLKSELDCLRQKDGRQKA